MGPQISAKQRERVLGLIETGVDEGARLVLGGGEPAHLRQGLVRRADAVRRRRQLDDDRAAGDLRPGARRHPVRGRRRRGADRQRQPVRPVRHGHLRRRGACARRSPGGSAPARWPSTAASGTAPTRRSAATRPVASAARTATRASSSTSRRSPTAARSGRSSMPETALEAHAAAARGRRRGTRPFWTGGEDGELRLPKCTACGHLLHPSQRGVPDVPERRPRRGSRSSGNGDGHRRAPSTTRCSCRASPRRTSIAVVALDDAPRCPADDQPGRRRPRTTCASASASRSSSTSRTASGSRCSRPIDERRRRRSPTSCRRRSSSPGRRCRPERFEHKVAITGIGMSRDRPAADAPAGQPHRRGVQGRGRRRRARRSSDIDGLATWPGRDGAAPAASPRAASRSSRKRSASTRPGTTAASRPPAQTGAIVNAMLAVAQRPVPARAVLPHGLGGHATPSCCAPGGLPLPKGGAVGGDFQWRIPFGAASAAQLDRDAGVAVLRTSSARTARRSAGSRSTPARNAALNPAAVYTRSDDDGRLPDRRG